MTQSVRKALLYSGGISWLLLTGFGASRIVSNFKSSECSDCVATPFDPSRDPKIGTKVLPKSLTQKLTGIAGSGKNDLLCAFAGSCQSCSIDRLTKDQAFVRFERPKVVVYLTLLPKASKPKPEPAPKGFDGTFAMTVNDYEKFNIRWYPRLALINPEGELVALQRQNEEVAAFLARSRS